MTKNKMMRIASVLLVAVLLTTCAISGTFAKYTSKATATDTARVAKWGWGTTSISLNLFDMYYEGGDVDATENVIAPGTEMTASIEYSPSNTFKPEVAYKLTFTAVGTITTSVEDQLVWTLAIDSDPAIEYATFNDLVAALETKEYKFAANEMPTINVVIGWKWAFDDSSDEADTALGEAWESNDLSVTVTMTATQIGD